MNKDDREKTLKCYRAFNLQPRFVVLKEVERCPSNSATFTHFPVCWDCLIVETFCRAHPELVVDRSRVAAGVNRDLVA